MSRIKSVVFLLLLFPLFSANASWKLAESQHFRIYYQSKTVDPTGILEIAEGFYAEMSGFTHRMPAEVIDIWVCDTQKAFQASVHAPIQDWAVGCAFPLSRRIIIKNPTEIALAELQLAQVLRHEIAHVLFGQYTRKAAKEIPLWFVEGIAIYFSKEWVPSRHETLLKNVFAKSIRPLHELTKRFPKSATGADLAYAQSQDALRWLVEENGNGTLWALIEQLHLGNSLNTAFEIVLGYDLATYDELWRASLPKRYHWAALLSSPYVLWGGLGALALLGYLVCWNRRRRQLNKLAQQEETVDAFFKV